MDEVIDDLISLESGFNDGGLDCMEPNIVMQSNVSMNHFKSCSNGQGLTMICMRFCCNLTKAVVRFRSHYLTKDFCLLKAESKVSPPKHRFMQARLAWEKGDLTCFQIRLRQETSQSSQRLRDIYHFIKEAGQSRLGSFKTESRS